MKACYIQATNSLINSVVQDFSALIESHHGIAQDELIDLWRAEFVAPNSVLSPSPPVVSPKMGTPHPTRAPPQDCCTCQYVFSRGAKRGSICSAKTKSGAEFCSKHRPSTPVKKKGLVFRRHRKFNTLLWNPVTSFVMRTKAEGVIGKIVEEREGDSVLKLGLSEEDVKRCTELSLPFCRNPTPMETTEEE